MSPYGPGNGQVPQNGRYGGQGPAGGEYGPQGGQVPPGGEHGPYAGQGFHGGQGPPNGGYGPYAGADSYVGADSYAGQDPYGEPGGYEEDGAYGEPGGHGEQGEGGAYAEGAPGSGEPGRPRRRRRPGRRPGGRAEMLALVAGLPPIAYFVAAGVIVLLVAIIAVGTFALGGSRSGGSQSGDQGGQTSAGGVSHVPDSGPLPMTYSRASSTSVFAPIATRAKDHRPLTAHEVFDTKSVRDDDAKDTLKLTDSRVGQCAAGVWGPRLAAELQRSSCTQVARGRYLGNRFEVMVTIFNLADANAAGRVVATADPKAGNGFAQPLGTRPFGQSYSTARGVAMGHYAVIAWAQHTDGTGDDKDTALLSLLVTFGHPEAILARTAGTGKAD